MPRKATSRSNKKISRPNTRPKKSLKPTKTIGILHSGTAGKHDPEIAALLSSLSTAGYIRGTNLIIAPKGEPLWSDDDPGRLQNNAHTLATMGGIDLIIAAGGTASAYAAQAATSTIPIVFTSIADPDRPAPNMTGVCARTKELDADRLFKLYDLVKPPPQTMFGVLENQKRTGYDPATLQAEADHLNIQLERESVHKLAGESDTDVLNRIDGAFKKWAAGKVKYVLVAADPIFNDHRKEIIAAEKANSIGAMHQWKEFKDEGGYASYGTTLKDAYQMAGTIAGQVLDGANPSSITVYVLGSMAISINQTTARRLRLPSRPGSRGL
jgi:putative tryptophan/tyrosine transport system substrate-binding protein